MWYGKKTLEQKTGRYDSFYVECLNWIETNIEFNSIRLLTICLLSAYIKRMHTRWLAKVKTMAGSGFSTFTSTYLLTLSSDDRKRYDLKLQGNGFMFRQRLMDK